MRIRVVDEKKRDSARLAAPSSFSPPASSHRVRRSRLTFDVNSNATVRAAYR